MTPPRTYLRTLFSLSFSIFYVHCPLLRSFLVRHGYGMTISRMVNYCC